MIKNDILRRIRYAINLSNKEVSNIFKLGDHNITEADVLFRLKKEDEYGFIECSDKELEHFLNGLIIHRRGERKPGDAKPPVYSSDRLSNNAILKKLRIALNFKEEDMLQMFVLSKFSITKTELSALFRKRDNKNYKVCGDQILRKFLQGITIYYREKNVEQD